MTNIVIEKCVNIYGLLFDNDLHLVFQFFSRGSGSQFISEESKFGLSNYHSDLCC